MAVLGVTLAVMSYGFVQIVRGNRKTRLFFIFYRYPSVFHLLLTIRYAQGGESRNGSCEERHSSILAIRGRSPVSLNLNCHGCNISYYPIQLLRAKSEVRVYGSQNYERCSRMGGRQVSVPF